MPYAVNMNPPVQGADIFADESKAVLRARELELIE
jgi:hypothetical protein